MGTGRDQDRCSWSCPISLDHFQFFCREVVPRANDGNGVHILRNGFLSAQGNPLGKHVLRNQV